MIQKKSNSQGVIYVVATPIGNLEDISLRALRILKEVDLIAVEDSRQSKRLLMHYGIGTKLIAVHDYNERERSTGLIEKVLAGITMAIISDAGTPLISDPGYHLISQAVTAGIQVIPIPGACAAVAALSVSGLPSDRFVFEGFLPARHATRTARLQELIKELRTLIFYESPHRIKECLTDMVSVFGAEHEAVIARELTKIYETIRKDSLQNLLTWVENDPEQQLGEFVILVKGQQLNDGAEDLGQATKVLQILLKQLSLSQAVESAAEITGLRKNKLYELALTLK